MTNQIKTDGKWNITKETPRNKGDVSTIDVEGDLELNASGSTRLAAYFVKTPMIENPNKKSGEEEVVAEIPLGQRLINKSDCKACHNPTRKTIGPSYVEIANRYEASEDNISTLASKIINGGSGNWGEVLMSAHPTTSDSDAKQMIQYILSLREGGSEGSGPNVEIKPEDFLSPELEDSKGLLPGLMVQVQQYDSNISSVDDLKLNKKPLYAGISPALAFLDSDFRGLESNFGLLVDGYLNIPEDGVYAFRLISDDGSKLFINDKEIINHDGFHGADIKDGQVGLKKGYHKVHIKFFPRLWR